MNHYLQYRIVEIASAILVPGLFVLALYLAWTL